MSSPDLPPRRWPWLVLALVWGGTALALVGWQKSPDLAGTTRWTLLWGLGVALAGAGLLAVFFRQRERRGIRRVDVLALVTSALAVAATLAAAEIALRAAAVPTPLGPRVLGVTLPPTWSEYRAANAAILDRTAPGLDPWLTVVVPDPELGWTIGPSRATPDGLYRSSAEGLRSAVQGEVLGARRPPRRIALVGDSYTFGMEVRYEDSWGAQLEALLGPDTQVLNFGVDGYGIDQAYLRWRRDVRAWRPDLVLFGFIQHDMIRTAVVYPFLAFGWDYPFAKPRFVVEDGVPRPVNLPLPQPRALVGLASPAELPFADLDRGALGIDWRWRGGDPPLVARLFDAALPRWQAQPPATSAPAMVEVSAALLKAFLAEARAEGSDARIVYFPTAGAGDFGEPVAPDTRIARAMLDGQEIPHIDLTDCLRAVAPSRRVIPGGSHYTPAANAAVARCLADAGPGMSTAP